MTTPLYALQVMWDLGPAASKSKATFEELRDYITTRSIETFSQKPGVRLKAWITNAETGHWGALYLFDTPDQRDAAVEASRLSPVVEMTGLYPTCQAFDLEAVVEGKHAGADLLTAGLAR